jgi:hypothetical protein
MKNQNINLDLKNLGPQLLGLAQKLNRYAGILFFILVAGVYGFVILRISTLSNVQPTTDDITTQASPVSIPKVDPKVVKQLEALKDNSSNVQTLFESARQNPFQE